MTQSILEAAAQEDRWRRIREGLRLVDPSAEDFATGGLGGYVPDLRVRMLVQPSDPGSARVDVDYDEDFWTWFASSRPAPWDGHSLDWGSTQRPSPHGAALVSEAGRDPWSWRRYLAIKQDGSVEFGAGGCCGRQRQDERLALFLIAIVGRVWGTLTLFREVVERYELAGPYEVSLALPGTRGAALQHFGEGWEDPWCDGAPCPDTGLLYVHRVESMAEDEALRDLAFRLGGWIENCWGSKARRFLAHRGERAGQFDAWRFSR